MQSINRSVAATIAAAVSMVVLPSAAQTVVPHPTVTGPVSGGIQTGQPWNASILDLTTAGYVEQEFFVEGTATAYSTAVPLPPAPFKTRVLVRRPVDPARFNGTVVAEWNNVTLSYDFDADFPYHVTQMVRDGFAYAAITAQTVGLVALVDWDPVRYAGLVHPGDDYSFDIYSQVVQALRDPVGIDPMAGLAVQRVIGDGNSQSASRLATYINEVRPQIVPVIDGFFVQHGGSIDLASLDVPVFHLNTESESGVTTPDGPFYRVWEIAGSAHADKYQQTWGNLMVARDRGIAPPFDDSVHCTLNRFPKFKAEHAALRHLNRWLRDGILPPSAPRIARSGGTIQRDATGNAIGGVRLPDIEVPVAIYNGDIIESCGTLGGETNYYESATLAAMYPSQAAYEAAYAAAAEQAVAAGYLLPEDERPCGDYVLGADPAIIPTHDCDGDTVADAVDNCRFRTNPGQADTGGIASPVSDGIGNACQCGDVTANGVVNGQDANAIRRHGVGAHPNPLFVAPQHCDVTGNGACNGQDANAVSREALGFDPNPLFGAFRCESARPPAL